MGGTDLLNGHGRPGDLLLNGARWRSDRGGARFEPRGKARLQRGRPSEGSLGQVGQVAAHHPTAPTRHRPAAPQPLTSSR